MKLRTTLMVLLTVMSAVAFATDGEFKDPKNSKMEVVKKQATYMLFYKGNTSGRVIVRILDRNQDIIFSETIKKYEAFARPYNFSKLAEGIYTIEVVDGDEVSRKKIEYKNNAPEDRSTFVKVDKLKTQENKVRLTIIETGKTIAKIRIYDADGNVIYQFTEKFENVYAKLFNLEKVKSNVSFEVEVNGKSQFIRL